MGRSKGCNKQHCTAVDRHNVPPRRLWLVLEIPGIACSILHIGWTGILHTNTEWIFDKPFGDTDLHAVANGKPGTFTVDHLYSSTTHLAVVDGLLRAVRHPELPFRRGGPGYICQGPPGECPVAIFFLRRQDLLSNHGSVPGRKGIAGLVTRPFHKSKEKGAGLTRD